MDISIVNNVLDFNSSVAGSEQFGNINFVDKVDDNFIHIGFGNQVIAIIPTDTIVNGLNFTNADDFINYYNSL